METCPVFWRCMADRNATAMDHAQKQQAQQGCGATVAHQPADTETPAINSVLNYCSSPMLILHQLYVLEELSQTHKSKQTSVWPVLRKCKITQ